jgi:hypothetical protein
LRAAADFGYQNMPPEKLAALRSKLTEDQQRIAQSIVDRYGHSALLERVLPPSTFGTYCSDAVPPKGLEAPLAAYPFAGSDRRDGIVILELTIGVDGLPRDPEILMAAPNVDFPATAIAQWLQARFEPATRGGVPIEAKAQGRSVFTQSSGGVLWSVGALRKVRDDCAAGDPNSQYFIGLAATLDSTLQISTPQAHQLLLAAAQGGQPKAQYWIGRRLAALASCVPKAKMLPWLQQAAASGDGSAQLALAIELLNDVSTDQIAQAKALLERAATSEAFYVRKHVAALMAASPTEGIRNPALALQVARKLAKDEIQSDPQMFEAMAVAYAANGNFSEAALTEVSAIKKAKALYWNTSLMAERLKAYQSSQPWFGDLFIVPSAGAQLPSLRWARKICNSATTKCQERNEPDALKVQLGSRIPQ